MTEEYDNEIRSKIARKGIITGSIILIIFTLLGSIIFQFYDITVEASQIMGGIIFLEVACECLMQKLVFRGLQSLKEKNSKIPMK